MIYYTPRLVIYALWFSSIVLSARQLKTNTSNTATYPVHRDAQELVAELAIFCDYDFANLFQNDDKELLSYWSVVMQDVHLRFTSLRNATVAFRLNSLIILESREEQQFLEAIRESDGTLSSHGALNKFARWVYIQSKHNKFTSFDIAALAVGSPFANSTVGTSSIGGICRWVHESHTLASVLTVTFFNPDMGRTLAHEIGHVLGAFDDVESNYPTSDCGNFSKDTSSYIMGLGYNDDHELLPHAFSPCSQKFIGKILQSNQSKCLSEVDQNIMPLIDTILNCPRTEAAANLVLEKHCQLSVNDKAAYISKELDNCDFAKCHYTLPFGFNHTMDIGLLNGMACKKGENEGFCFRGACLSSGNILMNVASKKCIGNGNYFGVNDKPLLIECQGIRASNPLNALRLETAETGKALLTMAYQSAANIGLRTKCLKIDGGSYSMSFVDCASNSTKIIWNVEKSGEYHNEFMLRHRFTDRCLVVFHNALELNTTSNCSWKNAFSRWQNFTEQELNIRLKCNLSLNRGNYIITDANRYATYYILGGVLTGILVFLIFWLWGETIELVLQYI